MKVLRILCGIAVLLNSLHLTHAVHHFYYAYGPVHDAIYWASAALAVTLGILSFIGGCLLLRLGR